MTAIGILLLVLGSALNITNAYTLRSENSDILDMLSQKEFSVLWQLPSEFGTDKNASLLRPPINENTRRSSIYFIAYADSNGEIRFIDTSRTASLTRDEAFSVAEKAVSSKKLSGKIGAYRYKAVETENNIGTAYVFLDTTGTTNNILRLMFISVVVTILCFGLMLLIMLFLSEKAIKPIAENMEKQKNFVTDAGHEIKTPLAIIMANTEALELHTEETKWSKNIKEQTNRLSVLMQDLLSLARLEDKKTDKMLEAVSLSDIAQNTISMFYESAALKGVMINESLQPDITLRADREHLTRLISILMDNAVKYCSPESEITVLLNKKEKKTILSVSNFCEALPECDSKKLFDRFYRGDSSHTQKSGGCGIGLAAARTIAELYKGKITAEYGDNNKITFTVIL